MRITMPDVKAPICQCGEKAEVYLYPYDLRVKCIYCGKKASIHYTDRFYHLDVGDLACLAAIISNNTGE